MMVDNTSTLASAITNHNPSGDLSETAIWGSGETNSLVAVLRGIFTWQLHDGEYDSSAQTVE